MVLGFLWHSFKFQSDQPKQGIVTTPAKLDEYVKEHGFAGWFETSAKENVNIEEAAKSLVNKVLNLILNLPKFHVMTIFPEKFQILMNDKQTNAGEIVDSDRFALAGGSKDSHQKKNCACWPYAAPICLSVFFTRFYVFFFYVMDYLMRLIYTTNQYRSGPQMQMIQPNIKESDYKC